MFSGLEASAEGRGKDLPPDLVSYPSLGPGLTLGVSR